MKKIFCIVGIIIIFILFILPFVLLMYYGFFGGFVEQSKWEYSTILVFIGIIFEGLLIAILNFKENK